jgi:AraC-like DNA-binding protein
MKKAESLESFYQRKFDWIPNDLKSGIGHFNVFHLAPFTGEKAQPIPYKRRDFYKIMLVKGNSKVHYADQVIEVKKQALSFSNPLIPYKWEHLDNNRSGSFCIFDHHFFHQFSKLSQYAVFQPNGTHLFELEDNQIKPIEEIYHKMFEEINGEYLHKYDVLRNLVFELLHLGMKMQPNVLIHKQQVNASQRIATLFVELLERQFPIDENHQQIQCRTASDFAGLLNVHVNHLNRAIKDTMEKTTTQVIAERVLQESKNLLKHSHWSVSEIAYALGFAEVTHFNNFFKKHVAISPLKFRNI